MIEENNRIKKELMVYKLSQHKRKTKLLSDTKNCFLQKKNNEIDEVKQKNFDLEA